MRESHYTLLSTSGRTYLGEKQIKELEQSSNRRMSEYAYFLPMEKDISSSYLLVDTDFPSTSSGFSSGLFSMSFSTSFLPCGICRSAFQALSPSLGEKQGIITANIIGQSLKNKRNILSTKPAPVP